MASTLNLQDLPKAVQKWINQQDGSFAIIRSEGPEVMGLQLNFGIVTNDFWECEAISYVAQLVYGASEERIQEIIEGVSVSVVKVYRSSK